MFPHHEDEIAQSAPIVGGPPARIWVHGEFLQVGGKKMAKSAGNIERIADVAARGVDPLGVPAALPDVALPPQARIHGRVAGGRGRRARLAAIAGLAALGPAPDDGPWAAPPVLRAGAAPARPLGTADGVAGNGDGSGPEPTDRAHAPAAPLSAGGRALHDRFVAAIDDDLDLPTALAVVRETLRADLPADERRWLVLDADFVLGLDLDRTADSARAPADAAPARVPGAARPASRRARAARDFATAGRAPGGDRRARLRRDRRSGRADDPSAADQPVARSRRGPNRSMIR